MDNNPNYIFNIKDSDLTIEHDFMYLRFVVDHISYISYIWISRFYKFKNSNSSEVESYLIL